MASHGNLVPKDANRVVMIYCRNLAGHRQIHCDVLTEFFLHRGFFAVLAVGDWETGTRSDNREMVAFPYVEQYRSDPRVRIKSIADELASHPGELELDLIVELQQRFGVALTYFVDSDSLRSLVRTLSGLRRVRRFGKSCGTFYNKTGLTHPWNLPRASLCKCARLLLGRMKSQLALGFFYRWFLKLWGFEAYFFPDERFVNRFSCKRYHFLPEISQSFSLNVRDPRFYQMFLTDYRAFLDANADRDVILCFGAATRRKGYDYLLRLVHSHSNLVLVHCGRHIANQLYDYDVDTVADALRNSGRLFELVGAFLADDRVVDELFSSTKYMVFPYRNHYFSSGIFFQTVGYGKPALVPNVGLLTTYVREHNIGLTYRHLSYDDFDKQFLVLQRECRKYSANVVRFAQRFTREEIFAHLEAGLKSMA